MTRPPPNKRLQRYSSPKPVVLTVGGRKHSRHPERQSNPHCAHCRNAASASVALLNNITRAFFLYCGGHRRKWSKPGPMAHLPVGKSNQWILRLHMGCPSRARKSVYHPTLAASLSRPRDHRRPMYETPVANNQVGPVPVCTDAASAYDNSGWRKHNYVMWRQLFCGDQRRPSELEMRCVSHPTETHRTTSLCLWCCSLAGAPGSLHTHTCDEIPEHRLADITSVIDGA